MTETNRGESIPYNPGHPWYYVLGGRVLMPKEIFNAVRLSGYPGYMRRDIEKASKRKEPERSTALRELKKTAIASLFNNLSVYREVVRELRAYKIASEATCAEPVCAEPHVSVSLKHNHLYNDFAHLITLDEALSYQLDLFEDF